MNIALTFDDGYREQMVIARYLARRGIKATFFVITGLREFMGRELLGPSEIKEIASMGHEIGSHTVTHIDMTSAPEDVMYRELVESKRYLSELLNDDVTSFAYPYGPIVRLRLGWLSRCIGWLGLRTWARLGITNYLMNMVVWWPLTYAFQTYTRCSGSRT
jgi:peptidoglycan/xylan/chitin deacetylase (PgdA/CDA1 family)